MDDDELYMPDEECDADECECGEDTCVCPIPGPSWELRQILAEALAKTTLISDLRE